MCKRVLTDIPGTPGMFWGDHTDFVGTFRPGRVLTKLLGPKMGSRFKDVVTALRCFAKRRYYDGVVTDGGARGCVFACLQTLVPWGRKPHVMVDCLWYTRSGRLARWLSSLQMRLAARSVTRFVVWASHEVEDYSRALGVPKAKLLYVPHYSSLNGYEYTVRDDGYLFAGGNGDRDYRTLVEAVRPLAISTWLATTNPDALRDVTDMPSHVRVEGTTHAGFRQAMAGARAVVVPMAGGLLHSGGQQTCLNAMMMGKPTIAVGARWARDFITDGENGFIVDYGDECGLRAAIEWVLRNPGEAREMGERGRTRAVWFTGRRAMETVYDLVLDGHAAGVTTANRSPYPVMTGSQREF